MPRIAPSRGTHMTVLDRTTSPLGAAACIVPAGEDRTIFALPWYGRDADRDHRQRLRRATSTTSQPGDDDVDYLLDAVNAFFGIDARPRRPDRRLRRRAAADLDRRPAEVGRHLAQGRAVRDLLGDADDHRRQADDLAADGEAGRRPAGRARGPRGALPHRRDPARDGGAPRTTSTRPTGSPRTTLPDGYREQLAFRYGHAGAQRARSSPPSAPSWRAPIVAGPPRPARRGRRSPRASSRRARSPTCCCAAPGSACSRRRSCAPPSRCGAVAAALGAELGWDEGRVARRGGGLARGRGGRGHRPGARLSAHEA